MSDLGPPGSFKGRTDSFILPDSIHGADTGNPKTMTLSLVKSLTPHKIGVEAAEFRTCYDQKGPGAPTLAPAWGKHRTRRENLGELGKKTAQADKKEQKDRKGPVRV